MNSNNISYNFSIAKVASILTVAAGHYFGGILWIPTAFALFVFAFSSGYFTSQKYQNNLRIKEFWHAKIIRLSYPLLVINVFLLLLFLIQGKTGIFSWQTLPSMIGVSGFLTWFSIDSPSPFGSGLWFFTLLLLFYIFYPLLSLANRKHATAIVFLLACLLITSMLHYAIPMGHMLWMTVFAFIFGSYAGVFGFVIAPWICIFGLFTSCSLLVLLNINYGYSQLNYLFIMVSSVSIVGYLINGKLPNLIVNKLLLLSGCVIQIYFIHTYLFIKKITAQPIIDFAISIFIIITIAVILSGISEKLRTMNNKYAQQNKST